jgi:uncharacterized membrane protein
VLPRILIGASVYYSYGRIILRWIFRKLEGVVGLDGVGSG